MQLHKLVLLLKTINREFSLFFIAISVLTFFKNNKAVELSFKVNKKVQLVCAVFLIFKNPIMLY